MCSYNRVRSSAQPAGLYEHACGNAQVLQTDLKGEMGFEGWVMSDWWAVHDGGAAAAGVDQELPSPEPSPEPELNRNPNPNPSPWRRPGATGHPRWRQPRALHRARWEPNPHTNPHTNPSTSTSTNTNPEH